MSHGQKDHLEATAAVVLLDRNARRHLYQQIADSLREAIIDGQLPPGTKLPPTRSLADTLGIARNRVSLAYSELVAEGYLHCRVGAGTFVIDTLPEVAMRAAQSRAGRASAVLASEPRSSRTIAILENDELIRSPTGLPRPFRPGAPSMEDFPIQLWSQLSQRVWRDDGPGLLGLGDPRGHHGLRAAIAEHLAVSRSVRCTPEQVLVVSGSQQALNLCARVLADSADEVVVEDPGRADARFAFHAAELSIVPCPVDDNGLVIATARSRSPRPKLIHVSPSHQFPLGISMSLPRRFELLEWATNSESWIIEDDDDGEFRYSGRPLPSLQGLARNDRVLHLGTFSRSLFPGLGLGYVVAPSSLVNAFTEVQARTGSTPGEWIQAVLACFIREGHLQRHLRQMRRLYERRQELLIKHTETQWGSVLRVNRANAGMHLVGYLTSHGDDRAAEAAAARAGIEAVALSRFAADAETPPGLLLGYTAVAEAAIASAVDRLGRSLAAEPA